MKRTLFSLSLLFLLGLAPVASFAQDAPPPPVLVQVDYMKATSPDYEAAETDIWRKIHQARIERGDLLSWGLYWVRFGDREDYDYVTINVYANYADVFKSPLPEGQQFADVLADVLPGVSQEKVMASLQTREMVRSELWMQDEEARLGQGTQPFLNVAYMNVPSGGGDAYLALERETWMPIHKEAMKRGEIGSWGVYELMMPGGAEVPYNYAAVNGYASMTDGASIADLAAAAHPNMTWDKIAEKTGAARQGVRWELWELVSATEQPEQ